ncbi:ABC transporter permease [Turicibacter sp. TJ11]|uniref:ABC transporter permease n=1 Tax=Turicibacter sp. TJ11 TaxID=2806443 RepID=UPI001F1B3D04|nr:ABC transporter permease [Turicibacter sp. TJ11]
MKKNSAYVLMVPGFVLLLLFLMLPLCSILWPTIFTNGLSLNQYISFFQDEYYLEIFYRTLKISLISTLVCTLFGVPTAYFISRCSTKWKGLLIAISIFPLLTNSVVRSFAWINILGKNGVINNALMSLGIIEQPISMLYTEFAVLVGTIYLFLPIMIITLVGVMDNIDNDMMEAAESLGANRLTAFIKVVLPMSVPGMITGAVLVFTGSLTAYTTPQLLGGNKALVLPTLIYQRAMALNDWTGASVIAAIMIVATLIVMKGLNFVAARIDKRGELDA